MALRRCRIQVRIIVSRVQSLAHPKILCISEIYQVTGPVERFAGQIASQGYVVGAKKPTGNRLAFKNMIQPARRHSTSLKGQSRYRTTLKVRSAFPV